MSSTRSEIISTAIMAVPERSERVASLLDKLGLNEGKVVWDRQHAGHLPTWWRAVDLALAYETSHVLIMEDDAEPSRDLIAGLEKLVKVYPDRVFSLYSNSREVQKARVEGHKLIKTYRTLSDVAMVYPAEWLRELEVDYRKRAGEFIGKGADEMRVKLRPGLEVWLTAPSLVEHGGINASTLNHKYFDQRARWFLGSQRSVLEIDWSRT